MQVSLQQPLRYTEFQILFWYSLNGPPVYYIPLLFIGVPFLFSISLLCSFRIPLVHCVPLLSIVHGLTSLRGHSVPIALEICKWRVMTVKVAIHDSQRHSFLNHETIKDVHHIGRPLRVTCESPGLPYKVTPVHQIERSITLNIPASPKSKNVVKNTNILGRIERIEKVKSS